MHAHGTTIYDAHESKGSSPTLQQARQANKLQQQQQQQQQLVH